ncbi:MAG: TonB-dependent receptor, partial [Polyangiaceae bacterium]|nr:TonB-dependent receptor [Polyangiaceae bacterium]
DETAASSVVRGRRLQSPGLSAASLLRGETGVTVNEGGGYGALSTAAVRGATAAQMPVLLAGVRLNDDITGTADLSLVPLWLLSRVEVYRGNAPMEADPWGIGGAIFFEPRRPKGPEAAAGLGTGSFGYGSAHARVGMGNAHGGALFGVRYEGARNDYTYVDDGGTSFDAGDDVARRRRNADAGTLDGWALATLGPRSDLDVDLLAHELSRSQGVAGVGLAPNRAARLAIRRSLYGVRTRLTCGALCRVQTGVSFLRTRSDFDDPLFELGLGDRRLAATGERVEATTLVRVLPWARGELSMHLRGAHEALAIHTDSEVGNVQSARTQGRLALGVSQGLRSGVRGALLGALDLQSTRTPREEAVRVLPALRATLRIPLGRHALLANAASYVRQPTLGELYGISGAVRGNPALGSERGLSADLGFRALDLSRGSWGSAGLAAFVYGRVARDLVAYRRSSLGYVTPYNVGEARVLGAELEAAARLFRRVLLRASATLADPRDTGSATEGNTLLPFQSRLLATAEMEWELPAIPLLGVSEAHLAVRYQHQTSRYADPTGLVVIPEQGNLGVELDALFARGHVRAQVRATNLLASRRFDTVGTPLPGRALYASTEVLF